MMYTDTGDEYADKSHGDGCHCRVSVSVSLKQLAGRIAHECIGYEVGKGAELGQEDVVARHLFDN